MQLGDASLGLQIYASPRLRRPSDFIGAWILSLEIGWAAAFAAWSAGTSVYDGANAAYAVAAFIILNLLVNVISGWIIWRYEFSLTRLEYWHRRHKCWGYVVILLSGLGSTSWIAASTSNVCTVPGLLAPISFSTLDAVHTLSVVALAIQTVPLLVIYLYSCIAASLTHWRAIVPLAVSIVSLLFHLIRMRMRRNEDAPRLEIGPIPTFKSSYPAEEGLKVLSATPYSMRDDVVDAGGDDANTSALDASVAAGRYPRSSGLYELQQGYAAAAGPTDPQPTHPQPQTQPTQQQQRQQQGKPAQGHSHRGVGMLSPPSAPSPSSSAAGAAAAAAAAGAAAAAADDGGAAAESEVNAGDQGGHAFPLSYTMPVHLPSSGGDVAHGEAGAGNPRGVALDQRRQRPAGSAATQPVDLAALGDFERATVGPIPPTPAPAAAPAASPSGLWAMEVDYSAYKAGAAGGAESASPFAPDYAHQRPVAVALRPLDPLPKGNRQSVASLWPSSADDQVVDVPLASDAGPVNARAPPQQRTPLPQQRPASSPVAAAAPVSAPPDAGSRGVAQLGRPPGASAPAPAPAPAPAAAPAAPPAAAPAAAPAPGANAGEEDEEVEEEPFIVEEVVDGDVDGDVAPAAPASAPAAAPALSAAARPVAAASVSDDVAMGVPSASTSADDADDDSTLPAAGASADAAGEADADATDAAAAVAAAPRPKLKVAGRMKGNKPSAAGAKPAAKPAAAPSAKAAPTAAAAPASSSAAAAAAAAAASGAAPAASAVIGDLSKPEVPPAVLHSLDSLGSLLGSAKLRASAAAAAAAAAEKDGGGKGQTLAKTGRSSAAGGGSAAAANEDAETEDLLEQLEGLDDIVRELGKAAKQAGGGS